MGGKSFGEAINFFIRVRRPLTKEWMPRSAAKVAEKERTTIELSRWQASMVILGSIYKNHSACRSGTAYQLIRCRAREKFFHLIVEYGFVSMFYGIAHQGIDFWLQALEGSSVFIDII